MSVSHDELVEASAEVRALVNSIADVLEGQAQAHVIPVLFAAIWCAGQQVDPPEVRALMVRNLRELADELEAMDATHH